MKRYGGIITPQLVIMLFTRSDSLLFTVILHCIYSHYKQISQWQI